jgi:hypothetical protein
MELGDFDQHRHSQRCGEHESNRVAAERQPERDEEKDVAEYVEKSQSGERARCSTHAEHR